MGRAPPRSRRRTILVSFSTSTFCFVEALQQQCYVSDFQLIANRPGSDRTHALQHALFTLQRRVCKHDRRKIDKNMGNKPRDRVRTPWTSSPATWVRTPPAACDFAKRPKEHRSQIGLRTPRPGFEPRRQQFCKTDSRNIDQNLDFEPATWVRTPPPAVWQNRPKTN